MSSFNASIKQLYSKDNSTFIYYTATGKITIHAGRDGVTEEWIQTIKELHRVERNSLRRDEKAISLDYLASLVGDKSYMLASYVESPEDDYIAKEGQEELLSILSEAFKTLTDRQRELFYAVRIQKRTITSIAREEGLHESSVRERLHRIENKLKLHLSQYQL